MRNPSSSHYNVEKMAVRSRTAFPRRKPSSETYFNIHFDIDEKKGVQTCSEDDNHTCIEYNKQYHSCHHDSIAMGFPFDSLFFKRSKRKCKFSKAVLSSILVPIALLITTFDAGCFIAQGFSTIPIRNKMFRNGRAKRQRFPVREQNYIFDRQSNRKRKFAEPISKVFSNTNTVQLNEAIISLEWTEYFSPTNEGNSKCEQTPVLFLHGLLGSKRNFATCANMLAAQLDKKRRIMGVDLRNHGDTQPWSEESK